MSDLRESVEAVLNRYAQTDGEDEWLQPEDGWRVLRDLRAVLAADRSEQ
jgi:hypothetical protein